METMETVPVSNQQLAEMEERAVRVNGALLKMRLALDRGDLEAIANLRALAQELNWMNRKALIAAGAVDSIQQWAGTTSVPDDDDLPQPDGYDLGTLRADYSPE